MKKKKLFKSMFNKLKILSKMKKIKLFALAAFAMLSTNVFAQTSGESATKIFTFNWYDDGAGNLTATITGFVADLDDEFKKAVAIPMQVTHPTQKVDGESVKYYVTGIAFRDKANGIGGFVDEPIETITFPAPSEEDFYTGVSYIQDGVFEGTKIKNLDLTNVDFSINSLGNLFGTVVSSTPTSNKYNACLESVTLPASLTYINAKAFENCTKLKTVDFSKAVGLWYIGTSAFAGCPIENLDLSKNVLMTTLGANVLYDDVVFKASSALKTVVVSGHFSNFNANLKGAATLTSVTGFTYKYGKDIKSDLTTLNDNEFDGCTSLKDFETKYVQVFGAECFKNCEALTAVDFSALTTLGAGAFEGTGITTVTIPATLATIPNKAFFQCSDLATVTFKTASGKSSLTTIGQQAFGYTALKKVEIPALGAGVDLTVGSKAFIRCNSLTDFTYAPASFTTPAVAADAFDRCSDVKFHTTKGYASAWATKYGAENPTNAKFDYNTGAATTPITLTAYSTNPNKFYAKWNGKKADGTPIAIKIKKGDAKVYDAWVDAADGSINMTQYKASDGYIYVDASTVALIITSNSTLSYEEGDGTSGSWLTNYLGNQSGTYAAILTDANNAMNYVKDNTTLADIESAVSGEYYMYGWMKAGGFQKVTSGKTVPAGTLFIYGKASDGARMTIKWYDEDGNLEAETTAIDGVKAAAQTEGQRYNVAGQKVNAAYKGLVIKDGKKYMQK